MLETLKTTHTVLKDLIANRLAMMVEKPGARHDCEMKPNFNSLTQMTSSPRFKFHEGMLRR